MDTQQILFLIILIGALVLLISAKLRVDVTAMLALMALALTGILDGKEALSGFSSEPAISVAAVFVLSAGLAATGVTDRIGVWIGKAAGGSEWRTAPLWGIGLQQAVNGHTRLLHDGRARNVTEAILWHGGEAEKSKEAFRTLSKEERAAVLEFIDSL